MDGKKEIIYSCVACNFTTKRKFNYECHLTTKRHNNMGIVVDVTVKKMMTKYMNVKFATLYALIKVTSILIFLH